MIEVLPHRTSPLVCDHCGLNPNDALVPNGEVFDSRGQCENCGSRPGDSCRADVLAELSA